MGQKLFFVFAFLLPLYVMGQCPNNVSVPSGCPTGVDIMIDSQNLPNGNATCANPSDAGCATFTFNNIPLNPNNPNCPAEICFIPSQGCGIAQGNLCIYYHDGMGGCNFVGVGGDRAETCIIVNQAVFSVTLCRPGNGPVSIHDISVGPCCDFVATCPNNTDLGTFDCNTVGNIPAFPTTQAQAAAPPYNITFGANPCGTIQVSASDDATPNACDGQNQSITRTVFVWDDLPGGIAGVFEPGVEESQTCTFTYNINASSPPVVNCPPMNINVGACMTQAQVDNAFNNFKMMFGVAGGCNPIVTDLNQFNAPNACTGGVVNITYMATDVCGQDQCSASFTVASTPALTAVCPPNTSASASCLSQDQVNVEFAAWKAMFMPAGGCGATGDDLTNIMAPNACGGMVTINYNVMDNCGQMDNCSSTFTVPACAFDVTCPNNTDLGSFDCTNLGNIPALPNSQASAAAPPYNIVFGGNPNCNNFMVMASDDMVPNICSAQNQTIMRTVLIWDDLPGGTPGVFDPGLDPSQTCVFTYNIIADRQAPTGQCPAGMTGLNMPGDAPDPNVVAAQIQNNYVDNCGAVTVTFIQETVGGAFCPGFTVFQVFNVSDDCGNSVLCTVIHSGGNMTPLQGGCMQGLENLTCFSQIPPPDPVGVAANYTGAAPVTATLVNTITNTGCAFSVTYVYAVTDGCTVTTCSVTHSGQDFVAPFGSCPPGMNNLQCIADIPGPDPAGVAANFNDNCGGAVTATLINTVDNTGNCQSFSRTYDYQITDACGNARFCSVTHSGATELLYGDCPAGLAGLTCISQVPDPDPAAIAAAYPAPCGNVNAFFWGQIVSNRYCSGFRVSHYYMVMDDCGNKVWCEQAFTGTNCPGCDAAPLAEDSGHLDLLDGEFTLLPSVELTETEMLELPIGLVEVEEEQRVNLYPNPTSGAINMTLDGFAADERLSIEVINIVGATVYSENINYTEGQLITLDLANRSLPTGTYLVKIQSATNRLTQKVILSR